MLNFNINFLDSRFINIRKTLREVSLDSYNGCQMTQSAKEVICFDEVVKQYPIKKGCVLSSVDALFFEKQEIFLVEFKNGCLVSDNPCDFGFKCDLLKDLDLIDSKTEKERMEKKRIKKKIKEKIKLREHNFRNELLKKFYETIFALISLDKNFSLEYFKNNATLILVYNEDKNNARGQIAKSVNRGVNIQKFGLGYMKGYCCKNIYTYTIEEFDKFLKTKGLFE